MIKQLLSVILICGYSFAYGQNRPIELRQSKNGIFVIHNDEKQLTLSIKYKSIDHVNVNSQKGLFSELQLEGSYRTGAIGSPQLPSTKKVIEIPIGAEVSIKAVSYDVQEYKLADYGITHQLIPFQPTYPKSIDPSKEEFKYNKKAYKSNKYNETELTSIEVLGVMRGVRLAQITVNPIRYNPAQNSIKVYNNITLEVDFKNGDKKQTVSLREKTYSPYFEAVYNTILNSGSTAKDSYASNPDLIKYPVKYLIVTAPQFEDQLAAFVDWKTKKGFEVIMANTDNIGSTSPEIKSWIQAQYDAGIETDPAPTFLLLVGDTPQIPASQIGNESGKATDLYYASVDGDIFPEMYYGRFSAQTNDQLQHMLDKVLYYEKYEFSDPGYLNSATLIAGADATYNPAIAQPTISYGTDYYFNTEHGFSTVNEYLNSYSGCYDADRINVGFINYTAHCDEISWANPLLTQSTVNSFTNQNKYPLAIGNCCLSADFGYNECLGETWMRKENGGSVAYIGSSPLSYWYEDYYWAVGAHPFVSGTHPTFEGSTMGVYDAPYVSDYLCVDALVFVGNLAVTEAYDLSYENSGIGIAYYWEAYNCLSDPSLYIYLTEGSDNLVTHSSTVPFGVTEYEVSAEPDSYVGISKDGVLYGAAVVPSTGTVNVPINPITSAGNVEIVVTKAQRKPYIDSIPASAPVGPYLTATLLEVNDALSDNNGQADFGESFNLDLTIKNIGVETATGVSASITTSDSNVVSMTNNSNIAFSDIPVDGTQTSHDQFSVVLADNIPDQHEISFSISMTDSYSKQIYQTTKSIKVNAPLLSIEHIYIDDSGLGNNDQILDAGEQANLIVSISNLGHASINSTAALFFLQTSSTVMEIISDTHDLGIIAAGASVNASFEIKANDGVAQGTPEDLVVKLETGVGNYNTEENYQVIIGLIPEFNMGDQTEITTSTGMFYDSGGSGAPYTNNENFTLTIKPSIPGKLIKVEFASFNLEPSASGCYDKLYVYNGTTTTNLIGIYCGTTLPGPFVASTASGALTFNFTSDGSVTRDGWIAEISSIDSVNIKFIVSDGPSFVQNATVAFNGETQFTNPNGEAIFSCINVSGIQNYLVSSSHFYDFSGTINIGLSDIIENVTLIPKPIYDISFVVTNHASAVENATVQFNGDTVHTNSSGQAVFTDVPEGTGYIYTVSKLYYYTLTDTIDVNYDNTLNLELIDSVPDPVIKDIVFLHDGMANVKWDTSLTSKVNLTDLITKTDRVFLGYSIYLDNMVTPIATGIDTTEYSLTGLVNGVSYTIGIQSVFSTGESNIVTQSFTYHQVFTVNFHVSFSGNNMSGINVIFNGQTISTDNSGIAAFDLASANDISYSISEVGYYPVSGTLIVDQDITQEIALQLIPDVTFKIQDQNGNPLQNAQITLNNNTLFSDENGDAVFVDIDGGENQLFRVLLNGYQTIDSSLNVGDSDLVVQITLYRIATITFIVEDKYLEPVNMATVVFNDDTLYSGLNGKAIFNILKPSDQIPLAIVKGSYITIYDTLSIGYEDQTYNYTLYLIPNVKFVVKSNQTSLQDASVTLSGLTKSTDVNGEALYEDIYPGKYPYQIKMTGYYDVSDTLEVILDDVTESIDLASVPDITFTVEANGTPITNAMVELGNWSGTTNQNGEILFADVPKGGYSYSVQASGYYPEESTLIVDESDMAIPVSLIFIPDVTIILTDGTNLISGAAVTLGDVTKTSDENGEVTFIDIPAGKYRYEISKDFYNTIIDSIEVITSNISETILLSMTIHSVAFIINDGEIAIENAVVEFNEESKQTNVNGLVKFDGVLIGNNYSYLISKPGFIEKSGSVDVADSDVNLTISLDYITYMVAFKVTDSNGAINGAEANFNNQNKSTNDTGYVEFQNVKPGNSLVYQIAKPESHLDYSGTFDLVDTDMVIPVNLTLINVDSRNQLVVNLYPNPTSGKINVQKPSGTWIIEITDQRGLLILNAPLNSEKSTFDLSHYAKGIYVIKLISGTQSIVRKIVLN